MGLFKPKNDLSEQRWRKAAVAGSIWGANEIIIGSFFHNINMPLTGTFLAMIGVMIMISTQQLWKETGIIWRAGLICAVMKSLSPSAIILFPMLGILTEALLMELSVRLFGRNVFSYIVAGALAVLSTLFYRIINLIIHYGWNIVELFLNIYRFAIRQLYIEFMDPWELITLLIIIYALLGVMAAYAGYRIGRRAEKNPATPLMDKELRALDQSFFVQGHKQTYSHYLALFHFIVLIAGVVFLHRLRLEYQIALFTLYALWCVFFYRMTLRRLAKPMIWVQFLLILILATVFLGKPEPGESFNSKGLMAGISMNLRALFVIFSFTALGIELRNPFIKGILLNRRFANFYIAVEMAFEILPVTLMQLSRPKEFLKNPLQSFQWLINKSSSLLATLQERSPREPVFFFITGEVNEGKTTYLRRLIELLRQSNIRMKGFLAPGVWNHDHKTGFFLECIDHPLKIEFCSETPQKHWKKLGRFYFDPQAVQIGEQWLLDPDGNTDIFIIDEIGRFELEGELWAPLINKLIAENRLCIMVVRKKFIQSIINKWSLKNVRIIDIQKTPVIELTQQILRSIQKN